MKPEVNNFLSNSEEKDIVSAIKKAEKNTSGEIRIHIDSHTDLSQIDRSKEVFEALEMHKTKHRNGVLIHISVSDKKFAIIGDKAIDDICTDKFWQESKDILQQNFKQQQFAKGIILSIEKVGETLKKHFPFEGEENKNELSDEISKGDLK